MGQFAIDWRALQWHPTVRVHWTSSILRGSRLSTTINIVFFSISTERRHVDCKMDIPHSFLGYKISRPYFMARQFTHLLELDAPYVGLQICRTLHDTKDKKRSIGGQKV